MIKNKHYQKLCEAQNKIILQNDKNRQNKQDEDIQQIDYKNIVNGIPVPYDNYDAKDLQYQWQIHQKSRQQYTSLDFTKVNKQVIEEKKTRQEVKQDKNSIKRTRNGSLMYEIYLPEYGHQYGKINKPSTPIQNVVQGSYGNCFDERQKMINSYYINQMKQKEQSKNYLTPIRQTFASKLYKNNLEKNTQHTEKHYKELFKMNKFKNIPSLINSGLNTQNQSLNNFQLQSNKKPLLNSTTNVQNDSQKIF